MGTIVVTGSAAGIGAATKRRLESAGHRVIGIDLRDAAIEADLATAEGRGHAIDAALEACGGKLDGFVPCAGVAGTASSELAVRVNY